jgi:hypothetical protein
MSIPPIIRNRPAVSEAEAEDIIDRHGHARRHVTNNNQGGIIMNIKNCLKRLIISAIGTLLVAQGAWAIQPTASGDIVDRAKKIGEQLMYVSQAVRIYYIDHMDNDPRPVFAGISRADLLAGGYIPDRLQDDPSIQLLDPGMEHHLTIQIDAQLPIVAHWSLIIIHDYYQRELCQLSNAGSVSAGSASADRTTS